jgi:hypothetical protein
MSRSVLERTGESADLDECARLNRRGQCGVKVVGKIDASVGRGNADARGVVGAVYREASIATGKVGVGIRVPIKGDNPRSVSSRARAAPSGGLGSWSVASGVPPVKAPWLAGGCLYSAFTYSSRVRRSRATQTGVAASAEPDRKPHGEPTTRATRHFFVHVVASRFRLQRVPSTSVAFVPGPTPPLSSRAG